MKRQFFLILRVASITTLLNFHVAVPSVLADNAVPMILGVGDMEDLRRVETYLEAIKTLKGRFLQTSSNGGVASGKVFMSRPGRMRFEYDPPTPILMIADGVFLIYIDQELDQVTHVFLKSTPVGFLMSENVELTGEITVTKLERTPAILRVTVQDTEEPEKGSTTLVFSDKPLMLRKWKIVDAQNIETSVTLTDVITGIKLDPELFVYKGNLWLWQKE